MVVVLDFISVVYSILLFFNIPQKYTHRKVFTKAGICLLAHSTIHFCSVYIGYVRGEIKVGQCHLVF